MTTYKSILIFGCGNTLWGDDGFGPAVIEHLHRHYQLPEDVIVGTSIRDLLFDLVFWKKSRGSSSSSTPCPAPAAARRSSAPGGGPPGTKGRGFFYQFPT